MVDYVTARSRTHVHWVMRCGAINLNAAVACWWSVTASTELTSRLPYHLGRSRQHRRQYHAPYSASYTPWEILIVKSWPHSCEWAHECWVVLVGRTVKEAVVFFCLPYSPRVTIIGISHLNKRQLSPGCCWKTTGTLSQTCYLTNYCSVKVWCGKSLKTRFIILCAIKASSREGLNLASWFAPVWPQQIVVDSILLAISLSSPELYHQDFPISGLAFNMALSDPPMTNVFQPHSAGQECMVSILYRYTITIWEILIG